jgi:hypothetical protein
MNPVTAPFWRSQLRNKHQGCGRCRRNQKRLILLVERTIRMVLVQRLPLADWRLLMGVRLPRQPPACEAVHDP